MMINNFIKRIVFFLFTLFILVGCGKKSSISGIVVDGKGNPISNLKIIAKQLNPVKGYEQFEVTTDSDGLFMFNKLFPTSEYKFVVWSSKWKTNAHKILESGPEGEKINIGSFVVRFQSSNSMVIDTKTDLMWAAHDYGSGLRWINAKAYCENFKGGNFSDWRLPTRSELIELYKSGIKSRRRQIISISTHSIWASKLPNKSWPPHFSFYKGRSFVDPASYSEPGALPVRNIK